MWRLCQWPHRLLLLRVSVLRLLLMLLLLRISSLQLLLVLLLRVIHDLRQDVTVLLRRARCRKWQWCLSLWRKCHRSGRRRERYGRAHCGWWKSLRHLLHCVGLVLLRHVADGSSRGSGGGLLLLLVVVGRAHRLTGPTALKICNFIT